MLRGLGIAALAVLLAGCTASPMPAPSSAAPTPSGDGVLRIGTLFSTATPAAAGSTAAVNAAVREIDAAGGVDGAPVEVLSRNAGTAGDGTAEASVADLIARGVDVVIGPSDVAVAELVLPLLADAGIPLLSPAALGDRPEGAGMFRTVPSARAQGAVLRDLIGDGTVALLRTGDPAAEAFASGLGDLSADIVIGDDPAADAAQIADSAPDAVVLAAPDAGPGTAALIAALASSGYTGDTLWVTGSAVARYDPAEASLAGAHGFQAAPPSDPAFVARIRQEDPGARSLLAAAPAYDATVLAALAATLAGDDGGPSIAASLPSAAGHGIHCGSYGECLHVLQTQTDVAYVGVSGPLDFDGAGDRAQAGYTTYVYGDDGVPGEPQTLTK